HTGVLPVITGAQAHPAGVQAHPTGAQGLLAVVARQVQEVQDQSAIQVDHLRVHQDLAAADQGLVPLVVGEAVEDKIIQYIPTLKSAGNAQNVTFKKN
ncbi:MAG: hypothetical protein J7L96_05270, partial [Bacteroidales bacterium]|nr:hypothetical protein [Bacteroidales bacterium]